MTTSLAVPFTAAGITVTPNSVSRTITLTDTAGQSIIADLELADDIANTICAMMRNGVTADLIGDGETEYMLPYDGSIGEPAPGTAYNDGAPHMAPFWCVTDLYSGIYRAIAGIKAEPIQSALARLGVSGYVEQGGPAYENDGYCLFVSSLDAARVLGVDEAALLRLGSLGLLGGHGRRDGAVLAVDVLRIAPPPIVVAGLDLGITATETNGLILTASGSAVELSFDAASDLYQRLADMEDTPAQSGDTLLGGGLMLSGATGSGKSAFIRDLRFMLGQLATLAREG